jgi:hypothetical protein
MARRRPLAPLTKLAAVVAALALVSSLTFVVLTIAGNGSDSPTGAVRRMFQSVVDNDPAGALEALTPVERNLVRDRGYDVVAELERLGLVTPFDHAHVPGVKLTTDALAFATEPLAGSITAVDVIGGRITLDLGDAQPISATARDQLQRDFGVTFEDRRYVRDFAQYPLRVVTTDDGSGWSVSLAYSVAEALRGASPAGRTPPTSLKPRQPTEPGTTTTTAPPQFGHAVTSVGAPSAEGAVRKFVQALVENEPEKAIELTVREEANVLYDYLPLMATHGKPGAGSAVNNLNVSVSGEGAERAVRITSLEADLIGVVQNLHLSYTGKCYQATYRFGDATPYVAFERCNDAAFVAPAAAPDANGDSPEDEAREAEARRQALLSAGAPQIRAGEAPPRDNLFNAIAVFGGGVDFPTFTVVERDERWYISPARTILDSALATLRAMKPEQVSTLTDRLRRSVAPNANDNLLREARDPDNALFGPRAAQNQPLVARCFIDIVNTVGEAGIAAYGPSCLRHLVSSGAVQPGAVEGMVLFGECLNATHEGPPEATNPVRRLFLVNHAIRACLQRHIDAGDAPPEALERMNRPEEQTCFFPYQGLAMDAPESEWAAADVRSQACIDDRLANANP